MLVALTWAAPLKAEPDSPPKVVEVLKVKPQDIVQTIRLIGTVKAQRQNVLIAKISGVLDQIAPAGSPLKKGDVIARIENAELDKTVSYAQDSEKIAKAQHERIQTLLKSNFSSKAALEQRKQNLLDAQQKLARSKIERDQSLFLAPFDGIVGNYKRREGDQVVPGDMILTFYDPAGLIVEFDVPANYIKDLHDNQKVRVLDSQYTLGKAQYIVDEATYMSPVALPIKCEDCFVGELVDVDLVLKEKKGTLVVPFAAVVRRQGGDNVYVVKDNKAILTPVDLGIRERDMVEIIKGLKVGDPVIIENPERLYPEVDVKIKGDEPPKKK